MIDRGEATKPSPPTLADAPVRFLFSKIPYRYEVLLFVIALVTR
jgi:hypothetical protein